MSDKKLVIFDGNALVHRAYHALPPLTDRNGEIVNAVYGFTSMLLKVLRDINPEYVAVAFDKKGPTFRHLLSDAYKANRPETPQDLIPQFDKVRRLVRAFNIPLFEMDGFEADDILGTISLKAEQAGVEVVIVTGDADAMQLVRPGVRVLYPKPGRQFSDTILYGAEEVKAKFGVGPELVADYKALVGDVSDNIQGVSGIGPKTAIKLLSEYGDIDQIYRNIDRVEPERIRNLLSQNEKAARESLVLAEIVSDMPLELDLEACRLTQYDRREVIELFQQMAFSSLLNKLPGQESESGEADSGAQNTTEGSKPDRCDYVVVNTPDLLEKLSSSLEKAGSFAFDTETTGLDLARSPVVGLSFASQPGKAWYVPIGHVGWEQTRQMEVHDVSRALNPVMESGSVKKIAHNAKFDIQAVAGMGIKVDGLYFDTMIAAYLLGEKSLGLKELAFNRLGVEMTHLKELIGSGAKQINMSQVEVSVASEYACADADITLRLAEIFTGELKNQNLFSLFTDVEMPLLPVLIRMEKAGILLDTGLLGELSHRLAKRLIELESSIYNETGHRFNINSPRQLGQVLFDELKLPGGRKTKSGYSTDAAVLESLKGAHPIVDQVIEFRTLAKLKTTYVDALPGMVNPATGRLHSSFNQTRTTTGRLSSSDPNLQNIPVRGDLGRQIRQAFIAPEGSVLLSGDYSQIDLRALAHLSGDPVLVDTFIRDEDVHSATAMQLFGVGLAEVTPDMRRLAKTVNFGVIYGMSGYGLEQATELNRKEAEQFITTYFEKYPGVKEYLEETKQLARSQGYVQTVLGRRRMIPEINSPNRNIREAAERMAINMPVQGTSADIVKVAMINMEREITKRSLKTRMLLQVHDELIFEVPEAEIEEVSGLVAKLMEEAIKLDVPVKVDIKAGRNWGDMEPLSA
ncbi:MAG: DNA polymerase I [Dehalococcoidales bacterium]|nr:DNA polymerase I [Dehalococcoidales bacterium]MDD3264560.1 DNA polymerase I [Dehalococcoidales bacterium]MDD4322475.1 DNA polymerase I [Dehalococcoidales bacterium]MDD4794462.1 DNA polymerase I [Dehalococcoidales bacterium]MDD5121943.1 DNA polymerase I [Dehalococcoidales bacterium]